MNKNITAGGIGGGGMLLAFLTWLLDPTEVSEFVVSYPKLIIGLLITLLIIAAVLFTLLINRGKIGIGNNPQELYEEGRAWKHTVLIVEDKGDIRSVIKDELQGFDVVDIERIDDYRLAAEFEIIISDILDCSSGKDAISVLNAIKNKYPYKYIIPMSQEPGACNGLDINSDIIIPKDNKYEYVDKIRTRVTTLANNLDKVHTHWEDVYKFLKDKGKTDKHIENVKSNYYYFVNKMQNGL